MTDSENMARQFRSKVEALGRLAEEIYAESRDFPAVNRNAKRILASVEMLRVNVGPELEE